MTGTRRIAVVLAAAALSIAGLAGNARAAGTPGPYVATGCGWIVQQGTVIDSRLSVAIWPKVAAFDARRGVADGQYVYAAFRWYEKNYGGPLVAVGTTEWRWTYAYDSTYTIGWKTFGTNLSDQPVTRNGGFDANAAGNGAADQYLHVTLYYYTRGVVTGTVGYWAVNPNNINNRYVCNGGGWLGSYAI